VTAFNLNGAMREVKRSALISESPARMYALINDIERYPEFVPGARLRASIRARRPKWSPRST
jgi:ribosome-associated toxin RatA of RatAB toxin-antitoxin module